jgi:hypothetical protein
MAGAALMGCLDKLQVDSPAIADQKAVVIGSQQGGGLLKAAAGQDVANCDHLIGHDPQPLQLSIDLPAGLVHGVDVMFLGRLAKGLPSGLAATPCPLHRPADGTAIHLQTEAGLQHRGHVGMGHAQAFIHLHRQSQGLRPDLYRGRP